MTTAQQKIFQAQAILEALAADGKLRDEGLDGMKPMAVEELARLGWQLLDDLPDWAGEEEAAQVKDPAAQVISLTRALTLGSSTFARAVMPGPAPDFRVCAFRGGRWAASRINPDAVCQAASLINLTCV